MEQFINPYILYALLLVGALGVALGLPRRGLSPQVLGAVIAAGAAGLGLLFMAIKNPQALPNIYFYIFSLVALGGALRVITHPRPVYAALYFVLTVIATAGLFLILSAEFMAFALIIVYAGAILITYLFVIMLATQAPQEGEVEVLTAYDSQAREPIAATLVSFALLALLTTMIFRGVSQTAPANTRADETLLADMPRKVSRVLSEASLLREGETLVTTSTGLAQIDLATRQVIVKDPAGASRAVTLPADFVLTNGDRLGFNLLRDHPGTIEIAGVILLMAMLGAVVLSRKQVELDEDAKARQSQALSTPAPARSLASSLAKSTLDNRISDAGGAA